MHDLQQHERRQAHSILLKGLIIEKRAKFYSVYLRVIWDLCESKQ